MRSRGRKKTGNEKRSETGIGNEVERESKSWWRERERERRIGWNDCGVKEEGDRREREKRVEVDVSDEGRLGKVVRSLELKGEKERERESERE